MRRAAFTLNCTGLMYDGVGVAGLAESDLDRIAERARAIYAALARPFDVLRSRSPVYREGFSLPGASILKPSLKPS